MKFTFKSSIIGPPTVIDDDGVFLGGLAKKRFMFDDITGIEKADSSLKKLAGFLKIRVNGTEVYGIGYTEQDKILAEQAYEFVSSHIKTSEAEAEPSEEAVEEELRILEGGEIRMRCKVCGKIFCYTLDDLEASKKAQSVAAWSSLGATLSAIGGTSLDMYGQEARARYYNSKIVDYSKCPSCHSSDIERLSNEQETSAQVSTMPMKEEKGSAIEQMKGLKELLDLGIITQEEFDAKKKQLLGL